MTDHQDGVFICLHYAARVIVIIVTENRERGRSFPLVLDYATMLGIRERDELKYYYYWIALAVFALDFVTKKIIENKLAIGDTVHVIGERFFSLTSIRNRGAAFSILQEQRIFFLCITLLVVAGIVWYISKSRHSGRVLLLIGLGLVLGGAVGNFLDRALHGEVVDFLQFTFGSYVFPSFNVADSGICCGVVLILLDTILSNNKENGETGSQPEADDSGQEPDNQRHHSIQ